MEIYPTGTYDPVGDASAIRDARTLQRVRHLMQRPGKPWEAAFPDFFLEPRDLVERRPGRLLDEDSFRLRQIKACAIDFKHHQGLDVMGSQPLGGEPRPKICWLVEIVHLPFIATGTTSKGPGVTASPALGSV